MDEEKSGAALLIVTFYDDTSVSFKMTKEELSGFFEAGVTVVGEIAEVVWFWYDNKTKIGAVDMRSVRSVETGLTPGE
jgi:hypothetical protein